MTCRKSKERCANTFHIVLLQSRAWLNARDGKVYAPGVLLSSAKDRAGTRAMNSIDIRRVGLVGLGKMGLPIGRLLCQHGFAVAGFDVDEAAMEAAAAHGMQTALSPQAAAAASDLVIIAVG